MLEGRCHKVGEKLIFFSNFLVQKHVFFLFLQAGFLSGDLVSQSLSVLNLHAISFGSSELGLDSSYLSVTLSKVDVITLSLSASSLEIFGLLFLLLLDLFLSHRCLPVSWRLTHTVNKL